MNGSPKTPLPVAMLDPFVVMKLHDMSRDRKLWDMNVALSRMGNNAELLREIIEMVRKDLPVILGRLRAAVADGDSALLQREAHSLRGTLVTFDAHAALSAALRLEQIAESGNLSRAAQTMQRVDREVTRLDAALAAELQKS
jgi:HPt (histidine-containing phosphotransfer) domain-containing protein